MATFIDRVTATTTAANVTLTGNGSWITVTNVDAAGIIYFRADGTTAAAEDDNYIVAAVAGLPKTIKAPSNKTISIYATASTLACVELHD